MKKVVHICLVIFIVFSMSGQNDTVIWNSKMKLKIQDFKAVPDTNKYKGIRAISKIGSPIRWSVKFDTVYILAYSHFIRSMSWFVKNKHSVQKDSLLLIHEKGHFDIREIELRKLRRELSKISATDTKVFKLYYDDLVNKFLVSESKIQKMYDTETGLSKNELKQKEWNLKIEKELKELDAYSKTIVKIPLKRNK